MPQPSFTIKSIIDPADLAVNEADLAIISRLLFQVTGQEKPVSYEMIMDIVDDGFLMLVISPDQTIVGMASALIMHTMGQDFLRLADLVIDESYRGQGIGRALIKELKKRASPTSYQYVEAVVPVSQSAANRLLRHQGFQLVAQASPELGAAGLSYYRLTPA